MTEVSNYDVEALKAIRENVDRFVARCAESFEKPNTKLLDIAPQDHLGAKPFFQHCEVSTLDTDPDSGATFIADLCNDDGTVPSQIFDYVVCTEVLEHTLQPFHAVKTIRRVLKGGGLAFVTTPFNFRIHGPLPDCWRFTEHGLRALFEEFRILELDQIDSDRFLAPIQCTLVAQKI